MAKAWLRKSHVQVDLGIEWVLRCKAVEVDSFNKRLKKAGAYISRNVEITIKMKTIVQKPLLIKSTNFVSDI